MVLSGPTCVEIAAQDLNKYFQNTEGAFVLYDLNNGRYLRYNERRINLSKLILTDLGFLPKP